MVVRGCKRSGWVLHGLAGGRSNKDTRFASAGDLAKKPTPTVVEARRNGVG